MAFTAQGVVVAGQLSTERATLELTLPSMPLPRVGARFERAGVLAEYSCVRKLWTEELLSPKESEACFSQLREDAAYREKYEASFVRAYLIDQFCIRSPGSKDSLPTIDGRAGRCRVEDGKLAIETTLAARALPRLGMCVPSEVTIRLQRSPNSIEQTVHTLPAPWNFDSNLRLRQVLCERYEAPRDPNYDPALSYQPGADGAITAHGHQFVGRSRDALNWITTNPTRLVTKVLTLPKAGIRLGRVEVRVLPPELAAALVLVDQVPTSLVITRGEPHVLVRDGEIQLVQSVNGVDDASLRAAVNWEFKRISQEGTVLEGEEVSSLSFGQLDQPYHDATFSRIGARRTSARGVVPDEASLVEWRYVSKERRYELVRSR